MESNLNLHIQHRQRLKARFAKSGFSGFSDHEILELLLCYALPRKDTNQIGHALINRFGSLSRVFEADIGELCEVSGISEHSALLLKSVPELCRAYLTDKGKEVKAYGDYDDAGRYFVNRFVGVSDEEVYAAFLDNGYHMIECVKLSEGVVNASAVNIRKIASLALQRNAAFVMLAHNHPGGTVIPSGEDLNVTRAVAPALDILGVRLAEHYIVAGEQYIGIMKMRLGSSSELG